jgi:hypothetical protein
LALPFAHQHHAKEEDNRDPHDRLRGFGKVMRFGHSRLVANQFIFTAGKTATR